VRTVASDFGVGFPRKSGRVRPGPPEPDVIAVMQSGPRSVEGLDEAGQRLPVGRGPAWDTPCSLAAQGFGPNSNSALRSSSVSSARRSWRSRDTGNVHAGCAAFVPTARTAAVTPDPSRRHRPR
jgi:hypothetical protein